MADKMAQIQINNLERLLEYEKFSKMCITVSVLRPMSNGDWQNLKKHDPALFDFIDKAITLAKERIDDS